MKNFNCAGLLGEFFEMSSTRYEVPRRGLASAFTFWKQTVPLLFEITGTIVTKTSVILHVKTKTETKITDIYVYCDLVQPREHGGSLTQLL